MLEHPVRRRHQRRLGIGSFERRSEQSPEHEFVGCLKPERSTNGDLGFASCLLDRVFELGAE